MTEFLQVLIIAGVAGLLTYLGAPIAERFDVPQRVIGASLQFAAGTITALVAFSLMPPAVRNGGPASIVVAFFAGGAIFVLIDAYTSRSGADNSVVSAGPASLGLYIGILADLVIDGVVIGVGSTLTLTTGLLLAIGLAVGTAPLAFVTIATAKKQGMADVRRRQLSYLFIVCLVAGAMVGYLLLRNQPLELRMALIAIASGFLFTTVTQTMIPEAIGYSDKGLSGLWYMAGLSVYALSSLAL